MSRKKTIKLSSDEESALFSVNFNKIITEIGVGITEISEEIGVHRNTIYSYVNGLAEPKISLVRKMYETYRAAPHFLVTGEGPMMRDDSVAASAPADLIPVWRMGQADYSDILNRSAPDYQVPRPQGVGGAASRGVAAIGLEVFESVGAPRYSSGDVVICTEAPPFNGADVVILPVWPTILMGNYYRRSVSEVELVDYAGQTHNRPVVLGNADARSDIRAVYPVAAVYRQVQVGRIAVAAPAVENGAQNNPLENPRPAGFAEFERKEYERVKAYYKESYGWSDDDDNDTGQEGVNLLSENSNSYGKDKQKK